MNPFSILTLFDGITPLFNGARSVKRIGKKKSDYYLFVKDGFFSRNIGKGKSALERAGVSYRWPIGSYDAYMDTWCIEIDYDDYATATSALREAGVKYSE